jgi:hypothetical protein
MKEFALVLKTTILVDLVNIKHNIMKLCSHTCAIGLYWRNKSGKYSEA